MSEDIITALRRLGWRSIELGYNVNNILGIPKGGGSLRYGAYPIGLRVPMDFDLEIRSLFLQLNLKFQSPYYTGSFHPQFISSETTLELSYLYKRFSFGAGFKYSAANFDNLDLSTAGIENFFTTDNKNIRDYKLGVKFGYASDLFDIDFTVYPRYLFRDGRNNPIGTARFDRNFASLTSRTKGTNKNQLLVAKIYS